MKRYLLGAALAALTGALCPSPASATPPSLLPFQQVPAGSSFTCGPAAGTDAATDASAAGFTTCALGNDFTTTIPNTVGTGLPSGWLNCTGSDTGAVWNYVGGTAPCPGSFTQQTDTGVTPNVQVLDLNFNSSYLTSGQDNLDFLSTMPNSNSSSTVNAHSFSTGYFEWTARWQSASAFGGNTQGFWSWPCCGTGSQFNDLEFTEQWPGQVPDWGWNYWTGGNDTVVKDVHFPSTFDKTVYNTVAVMLTGNSTTGYSVCSYLNGTRVECDAKTFDTGASASQRRQLYLWNGVTCSYDPGNISCAPSGFGNADLYIKSIKVNTCSAEPTGGNCYGTSLNGTGFYVP